jgi:putative membrane protein
MQRFLIAAAAVGLLASGAAAQSGQAGSHNPAVKDGSPKTISAPAKGANSFTENQARGRFTKAGYTGLSKLKKADGLWQGTATKGGKQVSVMLDYKGNITTR